MSNTNKNNILFGQTGKVISLADGIATIIGLRELKAGEIVYILRNDINSQKQQKKEYFIRGLVLNLNLYDTLVIILGNECFINAGTLVFRSNKLFNSNTTLRMFGRVLNALGQCKTTLNNFNSGIIEASSYIEKKASGIIDRIPVTIPSNTGLKAVDSSIPIGRGQRELIIGDRQTGKTSVAIDTILNSSEKNNKIILSDKQITLNDPKNIVWFVYAAIGQKQSSVSQTRSLLKKKNAFWYSAIVAATAAESAPLQFSTPYVACTLGEFIRDTLGSHCVIVFDDLSKHAIAYRQMSLLLRRPPGREAFPGDVFYAHSRLLERAGSLRSVYYKRLIKFDSIMKNSKLSFKFRTYLKRGTLTALPIIETQAGDVSAYIPTNVIPITDGQIFSETELFYKGIRPAINVGLSVSRVGSAAQPALPKRIAGSLKIDLAQSREIEGFAKSGASSDNQTQQSLIRGENLIEILKQDLHSPLSVTMQSFNLFLGLGYTSNWLIQALKSIKCFEMSYLSNTRIKNSWFELFRLNNSSFLVQDLKIVSKSFNKFMEFIGVSKISTYESVDTLSNSLINKYPIIYFDDFILFYPIETSNLSIDDEIKNLRLHNSKAVFFNNEGECKKNNSKLFEYKKIYMTLFKSDKVLNINSNQELIEFTNNDLICKFVSFVFYYFKYSINKINNLELKNILKNETFENFFNSFKLLFKPSTNKLSSVNDVIRDYRFINNSMVSCKEIRRIINNFAYINIVNYSNMMFIGYSINENFLSVNNKFVKNFFYKFMNLKKFKNLFLLDATENFKNSDCTDLFLSDSITKLKFNDMKLDRSLFENIKFLYSLLCLIQNVKIQLLGKNVKNLFFILSNTRLFKKIYKIKKFFKLFNFAGCSNEFKLLFRSICNYGSMYDNLRFGIWFSKLSLSNILMFEEFNFSLSNNIVISTFFDFTLKMFRLSEKNINLFLIGIQKIKFNFASTIRFSICTNYINSHNHIFACNNIVESKIANSEKAIVLLQNNSFLTV